MKNYTKWSNGKKIEKRESETESGRGRGRGRGRVLGIGEAGG
jgi:hypothetical protein